MSRHIGLLIVLLAMLGIAVIPSASAQVLGIRPAIVHSSEQVEGRLRENQGHATVDIEGNGASLLISYFASEPIEIFMVPLAENGGYIPTDFITFTLPSTDAGDAEVDLTVSQGWKPGSTTWRVNLLSKDESTDAGFTSMEFVQPTLGDTLTAAISHFFVPEPYSPSSFHALRGGRVLGTSFTIFLGALLVIATIIGFVAVRKNRTGAVLALILSLTALTHLRFGVDLLRMTNEHLTGYPQGAYDEAGSIYLVAHAIEQTTMDEEKKSVYVCRDGTNFKEKLLRYFVYPVPVSAEDTAVEDATLALVMDKFDWGMTTETVDGRTVQTVRCGALDRPATLLTRFPDGSILFSLPK